MTAEAEEDGVGTAEAEEDGARIAEAVEGVVFGNVEAV